jgi:hypothetical protein
MQARNIRLRVVKWVAFAALVAGLVIPSTAAGAMPWEVGLTECDRPGCTIVTAYELAATRQQPASPLERCASPNRAGFTCAAGE